MLPSFVEFARTKLAGNTKQKKNCTKGYACGYTCISRNRGCVNMLAGQSRNYADWLEANNPKPKAQKPRSSEKMPRVIKAGLTDITDASMLVLYPRRIKADNLKIELEINGGLPVNSIEPMVGLLKKIGRYKNGAIEEKALFNTDNLKLVLRSLPVEKNTRPLLRSITSTVGAISGWPHDEIEGGLRTLASEYFLELELAVPPAQIIPRKWFP